MTQRLGVLLNGEGLVLNAPGGQQRPSKPPALAAASSSSSARPQPATTAKQPCPHCQNAPDSGRFCIECAPRAAQQPPPPPSPSPNAPTGSSPFASPQPRYRRSDAAAMDPMWRRKQQAAQALKLAMGPGLELRVSPDERGLFDALVALVAEADPDFVVGWEVQMASLGYLLERAQHLGLFGLLRRLSRVRASWSSSAASDIPCPPPPPPPPGPHPQQQRPPPAGPAGPAGRGVEEKAEEEGPPAGQVGRDGIEHVAERRDDAWGLEQVCACCVWRRATKKGERRPSTRQTNHTTYHTHTRTALGVRHLDPGADGAEPLAAPARGAQAPQLLAGRGCGARAGPPVGFVCVCCICWVPFVCPSVNPSIHRVGLLTNRCTGIQRFLPQTTATPSTLPPRSGSGGATAA